MRRVAELGSLGIMPRRHHITLMVLLPCALLWSLAALMGRADSFVEVRRGKVTDWIILGPLWAGIAFIATCAALRAHQKRFPVALAVAFGVWICAALTANWWEDRKVEIRTQHVIKIQSTRGVQ